jgi:hypothetical protein
MKSRKARTLVTSIEFKLLNTNMYTIIVRDFLRWHFLAILQKNLNFVLESVFFNVIFFHQKIMKFQ